MTKYTCSCCGVKGGFIPYMRGERICVPCQDEIRGEEEMEIVDLPQEARVISDMDAIQLKRLRKDLGFNQEQMAKALGLSGKEVISRLENGGRPITGQTAKCMEYIRVLLELGHKINL